MSKLSKHVRVQARTVAALEVYRLPAAEVSVSLLRLQVQVSLQHVLSREELAYGQGSLLHKHHRGGGVNSNSWILEVDGKKKDHQFYSVHTE